MVKSPIRPSQGLRTCSQTFVKIHSPYIPSAKFWTMIPCSSKPVPFAIGGRSRRRKHFHGVLLVEACHLYTSAAYRFLALSLCLALLGFTKNATSGGALVRSSPKHATLVPRSKILPSSNQPSSPKTQDSESETNTDAINILHIKEFQ